MTTVGAASSRDWALTISNADRGRTPLLRLAIRIVGVFTQTPGRRGAVVAAAVFLTSCSGGVGGVGGEAESAGGDQNHAPMASNIQLQTPPASNLIIRVLDASTDRDGDNLKLVYVTQPAHGAVTIEDNGTPSDPFDDYQRYVCDPTYVGAIRFQYTISDDRTGRATGTVQIAVGEGGNNPPYALDDIAVVVMNSSLHIDVLANDSDPDGDVVAITAFSPPAIGAVVHDTNGTLEPADDRLVYTPLGGYVGLDSFTYTISDGDLTTSAVVSVEVGAVGPTEQVCGSVMKGALQGALIQLFPIDDTGAPLSAVPVAQALTDVNGHWCTAVPQPRVPMLVRSLGGQFVDETDTSASGNGRRTVVLDPAAFLETALMPSEDFVSLNVYTNAIFEAARRTTTSGGFAGVFPVERELYRQAFGWSGDLLVLDPANPAWVDPAASEAERVYAMALGGIANVINQVAVRFAESQMSFEMIRAVVIDLTDCLLDGHYYVGTVRTPVQFDLDGALVPLPENLNLNLSILRFRNNTLDDFGGTPLAQIDGGVCLGTSAAGDSIAPIFVPDPLPTVTIPASGPLTNLLAVVPIPLAVDNFDPSVDVRVIGIANDTGAPIALAAADVPPGQYDLTWEATDNAGNTTQRVQRIVIVVTYDGSIMLSPGNIFPGDTLTITVTDPDLDTDLAVAGTVDISVTNLTTAEFETVTLIETGPGTGVFSGSLTTQFGATGTDGDGILDTQAGETVRARYDDALDSSGLPVTVSDDTTVSGGASGTIVMTPDTILPGETLTVTVTDADLDTNATAVETVDITVSNATTSEIETVTLMETGVNTGVFTSTVATQFGTAGADDDGMLSVQANETVRASYNDALTMAGASATVIDDTNVNGGASGAIDLTPDTITPGVILTITVTDADLDTNAVVAETIDVAIANTTTAEFETVTLTETGVNTGVFSNTLVTQFGAVGTDEDGTLDVQAGETVRASYVDALSATGGPATVIDNCAVSGGVNGTIAVNPGSITPAETLTITVTDADLDTNAILAETVAVTVTNTSTAEVETVMLTETGVNTGVFSNTLATQFGTAGTDEDGILDVQAGETARASYDDLLISNGDSTTVIDDTTVTGGVDGTIELTPNTMLPAGLLTITVTDADLDTDPAVVETVDITVSNTTSLEIETVTLTETGVNTGVFRNTLATQYGPFGTDEDGILDVQATDPARGSYNDALTLAGASITIIDETVITGGSNGTIDLAPGTFTPGDTLTVTVTDLDLDTDPALIETVEITVTNTTTLEVETVTLTETGVNTAIFAGMLATAAGTGGSDNDAILEVQTGESAEGAYPDFLASTGAPVTRVDTSFTTTGETDLRLTMSLEPPSTDTVESSGDTVNLRLTLTNDGPLGATNTTIRIAGYNSGVVILSAAGDGSFGSAGVYGDWTLAAVANGATATTVVTVRIDSAGYSAYPILAEVFATDQADPDSTPANRAAAEDDADSQSILLIAEFAYVWTGNFSTGFFNEANWRGGATPPPGARVIIPANVFSRYPIIPGGVPSIHMSRLAISAGANIDMNGAQLEMTGSLIAHGPVIGDVWSHAGGFRAIEGTMSSLRMDADAFVSGPLIVSGNLNIVDDHLYLDGQVATVGGDLNVVGAGHLIMQVGGDMTVGGDAVFDGGGHNHPMTAGFLRIGGSLRAGGGQNRFIALPGHTTVLSGGAVAVEFNNDGPSGSGGSHFGDLIITNATTVDFRQSTHFTGLLTVDAGSSFGNSAGNKAYFETAFPIINGTIVPSTIDRFRFVGPIAMVRDETIYPGIKLIIANRFETGPHALTITNEMIVRGPGSLVMNDPAGIINVGGDFTTESTDNHTGLLTAGTVLIAGDFYQTGNSLSYAASPGHITRFDGSSHQVFFSNNNSGFGDLLLTAGAKLQLASDLLVFGQLLEGLTGVATIGDNGADFALTTKGVDVDGLVFDGVPITIGDGTIAGFDNVTFTAMNPAGDQLIINQTSGIATLTNIDFDTVPTTGALLAGTDIGGLAGDAGVTIDNTIGPARPLHGTPWSTSAGGFVINWGNPADDSDGDGLGDADEGLNGSNPFQADSDGDFVGDFQEFLAGSDPLTTDAAVFIDPNAIAPADGNSWASAWRNLAQAEAAGDLVTSGAIRFVLIAEATGAAAAEWQIALNGTVNNCNNLVLMGSLGDGIWIPQNNNGVPVTHLTLGGAATGSLLDFEKCAGLQLHDLRITGGTATEGGAIRLGGSSAVLRHLLLTDNAAITRGGALAIMTTVNGVSAADLDDVLIANNVVTGAPLAYGGGGGIYVDAGSSLRARRAVVTGNGVAATLPSPINGGGGIFVNGGAVDIGDSAVSNNKTNSRGAGLFITDRGTASGVVRDSVVSGNNAADFGGGFYYDSVIATFEMLNNLVSANSAANGGGIAARDSDSGGVFNNTFVYNQSRTPGAAGPAVYAIDTGPALPGPAVADNIIRGNIDDLGAAADIEAALIQSEYNINEVSIHGIGDLVADPLFQSGYYLTQATSPAVDHDATRDATTRGLEARMTDIAGTPDNNANLDAGYHYGGAAPAAVASMMIDEPTGTLTGASAVLQTVIVVARDAGGNSLPAGLEVIIKNTSISPVTLAPNTKAEPLGTGTGLVMTDLGDGRYLMMVDTSLVPAGTFTADIIVNRAAPQGISIGIL